jgi:hypothetical protein
MTEAKMSIKSIITSIVMGLTLCLTQACSDESMDSDLGIVGGQSLSSNDKTPAVGLLIRSQGTAGVFTTKTCTASRIGEKQFITVASCLDGWLKFSEKLAFVVTSDGKRYSSLEIDSLRLHPNYDAEKGSNSPFNVAQFTLKSLPIEFALNVPIAKPDFGPATPGTSIKVIGAGCEAAEADGTCKGPHTILKYLKQLSTNIVSTPQEAESTESDRYFFSNSASGFFADGDLGGPALSQQGSDWFVKGIASYTKPLFTRYQAYIWLGKSDVKTFIVQEAPAVPKDEITEQIQSIFRDAAAALENCGVDARAYQSLAPYSKNSGNPVISLLRIPARSSDVAASSSTRALNLKPCPSDPAQKEAFIQTILMATAYAEMAKAALDAGNVDDARDLLEMAQKTLEIALKIAEFGIGLTPYGRVIDAIKCGTKHEVVPKFEKIEGADLFFTCMSALGLDERVMRLVGKYVGKTKLGQQLFGAAENWINRLGDLTEKLATLTKRAGIASVGTVKESLSVVLKKVQKALGKDAVYQDTEDLMALANRLQLSKPDEITNLAGALASPDEVKRLTNLLASRSDFDAKLLGLAKKKAPGINSEEFLSFLDEVKGSRACTLLTGNARTGVINRLLEVLVPSAYADTSTDKCVQDLITKLIEIADAKGIMNSSGLKNLLITTRALEDAGFKGTLDDFRRFTQEWKFDSNSNGVVHTLFGEFEDAAKISGGLHTQKGLDRFVQKIKETYASNPDLVKSNFKEAEIALRRESLGRPLTPVELSKLDSELPAIIANALNPQLVEVANGVKTVTLHKALYNAKGYSATVRAGAPGMKSLFPADWTADRIIDAANSIKKNGGTIISETIYNDGTSAKVIESIVDGIRIRVAIDKDKIGSVYPFFVQ